MDYTACHFTFKEVQPWREVLVASLCELPFESFEEKENTLIAYIPHKLFNNSDVEEILENFQEHVSTYSFQIIKDENWNSEWEKNFKAIEINNQCIVRAPFHETQKKHQYDILINPQMSFGTGHHQTTSLILDYMTNNNWDNKTVLDMGCGTGVLAILAKKMGANKVTAIDIDEWSFENTLENIKLNNVNNIEVFKGDASLLYEKEKYDVIIANINRNILLNDFEVYANSLKSNGEILMSGFYTTDIDSLTEKASTLNLKLTYKNSKEDWAMVKFVKT